MAKLDNQIGSDWFCVRTKPKSEHIAARNLVHFASLEHVFCPRIRFQKATARGKVWFVESLFPGYIFAKFDLSGDLRSVNATTGVIGVLRFADQYAQVSDAHLQRLRTEFPEDIQSTRTIVMRPEKGDEIRITEGPWAGMETVVTELLPEHDRVNVLIEWLGQEREVEISLASVATLDSARARV